MTELTSREDYLKRTLDTFYSYYEREPFRSKMKDMGQFGISAAVIDVVLNPDTYIYVPNGGSASPEMPFSDDSNAIGVVVAKPGEQVQLTIGTHPLQLQPGRDKIHRITSVPKDAGASVYNLVEKTELHDAQVEYAYRRPTLLLPYDDTPGAYILPTVIAHEQTHLAQQLEYSVKIFENSEMGELDRLAYDYNNEFDAYQRSEDVFSTNIWEFLLDTSSATAAIVAGYRRRHLALTGGYATRENIDTIRRSPDIGHIVSRGHIPGN